MRETVSAIVMATRFGGALLRTIAAIERQSLHGIELIVIAGDRDPRTGDWWQALGRRAHLGVVPGAGASRGAAWNQAIRLSQSELLFHLNAGDELGVHYVQQAAAALRERPDLSLVTSWSKRVPGDGASLHVPAGCDIRSLAGDLSCIHTASLYRRSMWESLGGFDETLEGCEDYEFWIRALERGHRGTILPGPHFGYGVTPDSVSYALLDPERRARAVNTVVEKHRALFERHAADALCGREQALMDLGRERQQVAERRARLLSESQALEAELLHVRNERETAGQTGLDWGELRRTTPFSDDWGFDRGVPIDRRYIEQFLAAHASDIAGTVLEVKDTEYTALFGGDRVTRPETVDVEASNRTATFVADLRFAWNLPAERYDCVILTQTVHVIDDMRAVIAHMVRVLKPGGVLLATLPCVSRVGGEGGSGADYWRVTDEGAHHLFEEFFPPDCLQVSSYGNVLTAVSFLHGLASHELAREEFDVADPRFQMVIGVRAVKPRPAADERMLEGVRRPAERASAGPVGLILGYHRIAHPGTSDIHGLCVAPEDFWRQMAHLKAHYDVRPLSTIVDALTEDRLPDGAVAITIDDGYLDALTAAQPILLELGLPATFFVTAAPLEHAEPYWWDVLEAVLLGERSLSEAPPLSPECRLRLGDAERQLAVSTREQREAAHWEIYNVLVSSSAEERRDVIQQLCAWAGWQPGAGFPRPMNAAEVRRLVSLPGHDIGAHGTDHLNLAALPFEAQESDLRSCRIALEAAVGREVRMLAYPYGSWSDTTVAAAEAAGFRAAVTTSKTAIRPGVSRFELARFFVEPCDVARFARDVADGLG